MAFLSSISSAASMQTPSPDADDAASTPDADGWRQSLWWWWWWWHLHTITTYMRTTWSNSLGKPHIFLPCVSLCRLRLDCPGRVCLIDSVLCSGTWSTHLVGSFILVSTNGFDVQCTFLLSSETLSIFSARCVQINNTFLLHPIDKSNGE